MGQLHLVPPDGAPQKQRATLDELLALLGLEHFDAIEQRARVMRESFPCPLTVPDFAAFQDVLYDFYAHYQKAFFNADLKAAAAKVVGGAAIWKQDAYRFLQTHLGSDHALLTAERDAIMGREGGMIRVIDEFTEGIIKLHTQTYIQSVFSERIAPSDFALRMQLAAELLKRFGRLLFPGVELLPDFLLGANVEAFIRDFALRLHPVLKQWRY